VRERKEMAKSKLVGFKSFTSKAGKQCNMASVVTDYTPAEIARGCVGAESQTIFLPDATAEKITSESIGKEVELIYSIRGGRAFLEDMVFVGK